MVRYARAGTHYEVALEEIGLAVLRQELKTAAKALLAAHTPSYCAKQLSESLLFVQGSGLDYVINQFGIEVDAVTLRNTFFAWTSRQRHKSL